MLKVIFISIILSLIVSAVIFIIAQKISKNSKKSIINLVYQEEENKRKIKKDIEQSTFKEQLLTYQNIKEKEAKEFKIQMLKSAIVCFLISLIWNIFIYKAKIMRNIICLVSIVCNKFGIFRK